MFEDHPGLLPTLRHNLCIARVTLAKQDTITSHGIQTLCQICKSIPVTLAHATSVLDVTNEQFWDATSES